jgi:hypothetical protein
MNAALAPGAGERYQLACNVQYGFANFVRSNQMIGCCDAMRGCAH